MNKTALQALYMEQGQAPWLDNISRSLIKSGELRKMIDEVGIVGMTSNPTIFEKAIADSTDYDTQMEALVSRGRGEDQDPSRIFLELMLKDIADAADVLRDVFERTAHLDGYVSIEVTPDVAGDTQKSIEQARWFKKRLQRPNIFVKIPATDEGVPAIEQAIYEGISINITLIFALERYRQVIDAYMRGLERRLAEGSTIDNIWSVASFFVSRVDTNVDKKLDVLIAGTNDQARRRTLEALKGKAAIANARIAYEIFQESLTAERWQKLAARGGHVQRPLWASTSTKNPAYPDVLYVDSLIGPHTVNTMPATTIAAFNDHGKVARTVDQDILGAHRVLDELNAVGIYMDEVTKELEAEGAKSFASSYETLNLAISGRLKMLSKGQVSV